MAQLRVSVRSLTGQLAIGRQESDHTLLLDRPIATGGTGLGFNGGHLMLLGWGACFKSTLLAAAEARGIAVESLELEICGETGDGTRRFERLSMRVRLEGPSEADKAKLVTLTREWCVVSNTLSTASEMDIVLDG